MNKRASKPTPTKPLVPVVEKWKIIAGIIAVILTGIFGIISSILENPNTVIFPTKPANTVTFANEAIAAPSQALTTPGEPSPIPSATSWALIHAVRYTDDNAICTISSNGAAASGRTGAVEIRYDIPQTLGYCSWVVPLNGFDASMMNTITFWVKGQNGGEAFEIGITRTGTPPGQELKRRQNAAAEWQQITVPLTDFGEMPMDSLENISLGFTHDLGSGTIYVSDFVFTH